MQIGLRFQSHFPKSNPSVIWECKRITQENNFFEKIISEVLNLKMNVLLPGVGTKIVGKELFSLEANCGRAICNVKGQ